MESNNKTVVTNVASIMDQSGKTITEIPIVDLSNNWEWPTKEIQPNAFTVEELASATLDVLCEEIEYKNCDKCPLHEDGIGCHNTIRQADEFKIQLILKAAVTAITRFKEANEALNEELEGDD